MTSAHASIGFIRYVSPLIGAWIAIFPLVARAQTPPDPQQTAVARALFEEGVRFADAEQWEEASDRFRRSLALRASPVVAYNLASALVRVGALVEAAELLEQVERDEEAPRAARDAAAQLARQVRPRLGRLTIHLDGFPMEVQVELDGRPLLAEAIGVAIPADPGTAEVKVVRAGEIVAEGTVEVPESGSAEVRLDVPPPPLVAPEPEAGFRPGDVLRGAEPSFTPGDILLHAEIPAPAPPEPEPIAEPEPPPPARPAPRPAPRPEPDGGLLESPWFWVAAASGLLLVAGGIGAVILIKQSE